MSNKLKSFKKEQKTNKQKNSTLEKIKNFLKNNIDERTKNRTAVNDIISNILMELFLVYIGFLLKYQVITISGIVITLFLISLSIIKMRKNIEQKIQYIIIISSQIIFLFIFIFMTFSQTNI